MTLRNLLSIYAVLSAIGGVLWIAVPATLLSLFDAPAEAVPTFLAALYGGAVLGLGVMSWLSRDLDSSRARNAIVVGIAVTNTVWFALSLMATLAGHFNSLAWIPVAAFFLWSALFVVAGRSAMMPVVRSVGS
jgi:hypothetical protein